MLQKCPECELQVSDKATSCPHCGYPMQTVTQIRKTRNKNNKRRRLPNGFGQISEIKGRYLRKPFRAMVTVGKTELGRPISKPLKPDSYFETYNDAYSALVEYNKNPYDLAPSTLTRDLYENWTEEYFSSSKADSTIRGIKTAWHYCSSIYNMRVADIRVRHIKGCIDEGAAIVDGVQQTAAPSVKKRIKSLFNLMLDYAVEYELVDRNYARTFKISDEVIKEIERHKQNHIAFSDDEVSLLWAHVETKQYVDIMLIQCYSGWRPQELGLITLEDTDMENWTFKGGIKTDAGIDRIVPIHSRIRALVAQKYKEAEKLGNKYLFTYVAAKNGNQDDLQLTYPRYYKAFTKVCDELKLNPVHSPHDGRIHFVTMAKKYGVDEYAIKYIVGHSVADITEKVYTRREINWLQEEIEKIR